MIYSMLGIYTFFYFFLMITTCVGKYKKYYTLAKGVQSFLFVVFYLFVASRMSERTQLMVGLPAFLLCFFGDVFLGYYNYLRKKRFFVVGLLIFLGGHICFVAELCYRQPLQIVDLVVPIVAVLFTAVLIRQPFMHVGHLKPFILLYTFFVALFFGKSVHLLISQLQIQYVIRGFGAFLFLISDFSILFLYFYRKKKKWIHVFNLTAYYYGVFLLAVSAAFP